MRKYLLLASAVAFCSPAVAQTASEPANNNPQPVEPCEAVAGTTAQADGCQGAEEGQAANTGQATEQTDDVNAAEIVVTGQKRVERLIDAPQTVNVVSGDQIDKLNLTRLEDIQKTVPGLDLTTGDGRQQSVSLRGVKFDPDAGTNRTVDIYLNEVPFETTQALQAQFDINSIQVLRGPQGTLRGGTGPSGAILIGTRQANLVAFEANGSASYTNRESLNIQGGVGIPIINDKLGVRIAGLLDRTQGNGVRNITNDREAKYRAAAGRISFTFRPTEALSFLLMHQRFNSETSQPRAIATIPGSPEGAYGHLDIEDRTAVSLGDNQFKTQGRTTMLNGTWDVGEHRLSYVGSYQKNDFDTTRDLNLANVPVPGYFAFVPGLEFLANYEFQQYQKIDIRTKQLTNEVRFERTGDHFWLYRFGAYFSNAKTAANVLVDYTGANGECQTAPGPLAFIGLPCLVIGGDPVPRTRDRGFFTTQTFNLTPNDTLDLGVRYSQNRSNVGDDFNAWTGTASYKHRFSDALLAYLSWGRGFRPGGTDTTGAGGAPALPASFFSFDSEKSDSYEAGIKGSLSGGRMIYTLAAYHQKFDGFINRINNIQCTGNPNSGTGPVPGTVFPTSDGLPPTGANSCAPGGLNLTYNAPAIARGVEIELRGRIAPGWNAQALFTYANARFDDAAIPCNDFNGDGTPDSVGTPAVQAGQYVSFCQTSQGVGAIPKYQASANTDYNFGLSRTLDGYVRLLGRYGSKAKLPGFDIKYRSYLKFDAFAGVRAGDRIEVGVFAKNLLDQRRDRREGDIFGLFGDASNYEEVVYDERRQIGVQSRLTF